QSVRASIHGPDVSGHSATTRDPAVYAIAEGDDSGPRPGCAPYRHDRGAPGWHCGHTRGSCCWGIAPIRQPAFSATAPEIGPSSKSHVLRNSCGYTISLAWQHLSRLWPKVLHLDLEPKHGFFL